MTTSPESSAESPAAQPAAKSAQLRGRTEPHMHSFNMPQCEPINPYERPSYPFFYVPTDLLIGGSWVTGDNGSFPVHNPSCGQILTHVADASVEQGIEALDAACDARASWAAALELPNVRGLVVGRSLLYPGNDDVEAAVDAAVALL